MIVTHVTYRPPSVHSLGLDHVLTADVLPLSRSQSEHATADFPHTSVEARKRADESVRVPGHRGGLQTRRQGIFVCLPRRVSQGGDGGERHTRKPPTPSEARRPSRAAARAQDSRGHSEPTRVRDHSDGGGDSPTPVTWAAKVAAAVSAHEEEARPPIPLVVANDEVQKVHTQDPTKNYIILTRFDSLDYHTRNRPARQRFPTSLLVPCEIEISWTYIQYYVDIEWAHCSGTERTYEEMNNPFLMTG